MPISSVERVSGGWDQGATKTLTLAATPPAGRLLTCRFVSDVVLSPPSGWTRYGTYPGGSADVGLFARLADGTVNSITLVGSGDTVAVLDHWSGNVSSTIAACKDQNAQANNSTSSGTTGTTAQADEIALVVLGAGTNSTGTWSAWTNSFVEDADVQSPGGAGTEVSGGFASRVLTATGAYSTSAVNTASVSNKSGCIVTFRAAAGGASGTLHATAPMPTASTSATARASGQLTAVAPMPTASMSATSPTASATLEATAPMPTASMTAAAKASAVLAAVAPMPQASTAAASTSGGQLAAVAPMPTAAATATATASGQLAAVAPMPTAAATATATASGQLDATAPMPIASMNATVLSDTATATLDAVAPMPTVSMAATAKAASQLDTIAPMPTAAMSATATVASELDAVAPMPMASMSAEAVGMVEQPVDVGAPAILKLHPAVDELGLTVAYEPLTLTPVVED